MQGDISAYATTLAMGQWFWISAG